MVGDGGGVSEYLLLRMLQRKHGHLLCLFKERQCISFLRCVVLKSNLQPLPGLSSLQVIS